jgi:hypothetical protein
MFIIKMTKFNIRDVSDRYGAGTEVTVPPGVMPVKTSFSACK